MRDLIDITRDPHFVQAQGPRICLFVRQNRLWGKIVLISVAAMSQFSVAPEICSCCRRPCGCSKKDKSARFHRISLLRWPAEACPPAGVALFIKRGSRLGVLRGKKKW